MGAADTMENARMISNRFKADACRVVLVTGGFIGGAALNLGLPQWAISGIGAGVAAGVFIGQRTVWNRVFKVA
ncbi:hypothetical protein [Paraburkholderia sp. SIMBA_054]|uniref:hypothetical protein n=1 Tax=Paraburkholderia sp. SIMBA_054 TaxID=3085795 RepID=UPI003978920B